MAIGHQLSDNNPAGTGMGQSTTDLLSFYGGNPIAQPTNASDLVTALQNLGLLASGTYTITGVANPSVNETASSVSSVTAVAATGFSRINSSVAKTYYLSAPTKGTEKFLYVDVPSTAVITVKVNSTEVASSLIIIGIPGSQSTLTSSSASSLGNILISNTTANTGAGVSLVAASSVEWIVKSINSTLVTYTT